MYIRMLERLTRHVTTLIMVITVTTATTTRALNVKIVVTTPAVAITSVAASQLKPVDTRNYHDSPYPFNPLGLRQYSCAHAFISSVACPSLVCY